MGRVASRSLIGLFIFFSYLSLARAATFPSPFNDLPLDLDEDTEDYSFLVAGHLYGARGTASVFPASSLLANLDLINSSGAKFFISLGDIFRSANAVHIPNFQNAFASKLNMPLFNAVGNHDQSNRQLYEATFGETYYHFVYNKALFIFLDTELDAGNILDNQLDFFLRVTDQAISDPEIKNVFILSHKLIWSVNDPAYQIVFQNANERYPDNNFGQDIEPTLAELSKHKVVYWVSGDIGPGLPLFYRQEPNHNLTYIAVGLGDTKRDAVLQVNVSKSKGVTFVPISLTGQDLEQIEDYGLDYWRNYFGSESIVDDYMGKLKRTLRTEHFWLGILVSIPVAGLVILITRRQKGL